METRPSDPSTFAQFAETHGRRLRQALVARYGVDVGTEAHADAMAWAWEHWDEVDPMSNPVGYLYRVGQSASRRYRRWTRAPALPPEPPTAASADVGPGLEAALTRLSERQRVVVVLVHAHGWSYADVADALGVSHASVRNQLHRGLKRLRHLLKVGDDV